MFNATLAVRRNEMMPAAVRTKLRSRMLSEIKPGTDASIYMILVT